MIPVIVFVVVIGALALDRRGEQSGLPIEGKDAAEALGLMKEWVTWSASLQIGILAAIGSAIKSYGLTLCMVSLVEVSVACFGLSISSAAWLLGGLPSVRLRLLSGRSSDNDIYQMNLFTQAKFVVRVGRLFGVHLWLFAGGIIFLCWFGLALVSNGLSPKP
jgi:hypothetical protein